MMKKLQLTFTLFIISIFCGIAQPYNQEVVIDGKSPVLLGKINQAGLMEGTYDKWFSKNYENYEPKVDVVAQLKNELSTYTITAFMGTWCGDSKREVPRFYKILNQANFPLERLTLIAVSRDREAYKQSPGGEEEGLNIHRVPTFIFYKNGKEVNRIVESPVETLEEDIVAILNDQYTSSYYAVTMVNDLLLSTELKKFEKKSKKLLPKIKGHVKKMSELNTYSSVLFYSGKTEEAIAVAKLNTKLFPEEAETFNRLGNKLNQLKRKTEALENYEKALALDPKNEKIQKSIASLKTDSTN